MPLRHLLVVLTHAPYGHENAFAGVYVALGALSKNIETTVLLMSDGAYIALRDQQDSLQRIHLPSLAEQIADIIDLGGEVYAIEDDAALRGLAGTDLLDGVQLISRPAALELVIERGELQLSF